MGSFVNIIRYMKQLFLKSKVFSMDSDFLKETF